MSPAREKEIASSVDQATPERRHSLRFPFTASIEAIESESGARITGRTTDLSVGGCYVDTISPLPVGADAKIRLTRGEESFEAQAKVVYSKVGMGMGLAFVSAQPNQVQLFQRWVLELSGKLPSGSDMPEKGRPEGADGNLKEEQSYVLSELVIALMRKGVLAEEEGKAMLRKLHQ